jgi:hypothetical protein
MGMDIRAGENQRIPKP